MKQTLNLSFLLICLFFVFSCQKDLTATEETNNINQTSCEKLIKQIDIIRSRPSQNDSLSLEIPPDLKEAYEFVFYGKEIFIKNAWKKIPLDDIAVPLKKLREAKPKQNYLMAAKALHLYSNQLIIDNQIRPALDSLNQAQSIIQEFGNQTRQDSIEIAEILNLKVSAYQSIYDKTQSLSLSKKTYDLNMALGRLEEMPTDLTNIGLTFSHAKMLDSSAYYLDLSICAFNYLSSFSDIDLSNYDTLGTYNTQVINSISIGDMFNINGDSLKAAKNYQKGINKAVFIYDELIKKGINTSLMQPFFYITYNLMGLHFKLNAPESSERILFYVNNFVEKFSGLGMEMPPFLNLKVLQFQALAYYRSGQCDKGNEKREALAKIIDSAAPVDQMQAHYVTAIGLKSCETSQDTKRLEEHLSNIDALERLLISSYGEASSQVMRKGTSHYFRDAIQTANEYYKRFQDEKYFEIALQLVDKSKSLTLRQRIYQNMAALNFKGKKRRLLEEEQKILENIKQNKAFPTDYAKFKERLRTSNDLVEQTYFQDRFFRPSSSIQQIRAQLLDKNTALVEYYMIANQGFVYVVTPSDYQLFSFDINEELKQSLEAYMLGSNAKNHRSKNYNESAHLLYKAIFEEVDHWLKQEAKGINQLVISPSKELYHIAFDGLSKSPMDGDNYQDAPFLLQDYIISYQFSTGSQIALNKLKQQKSNQKAALVAFIAASKEASEDNKENFAGCSNDPLPSLYDATISIGASWESKGMKADIKPNATESDFKNYIENKKFDIWQFTMHGCANDQHADDIYLQFFESKADDGQLTIKELSGYYLDAQLAVLSSCNTALGPISEGEGTFSLARTFAYTGCPSVIATTNFVFDKSTAEILEIFYRNLAKGQSKHEALTKAKRTYIDLHPKEHPVHWFPIVCIGDYRPIEGLHLE